LLSSDTYISYNTLKHMVQSCSIGTSADCGAPGDNTKVSDIDFFFLMHDSVLTV